MRVGTDAVLLGAWCPLPDRLQYTYENTESLLRVLDIGTGCGVIALMVAQRIAATGITDWLLDAIDIDEASAMQAAANFAASPWNEQMAVYHGSVQEWQGQYDLVVSNPPFFNGGLTCPNGQRARARQADISMTYEQLIAASCRLLKPKGLLGVVIPSTESERFFFVAQDYALKVMRRCEVHTKENKPASRLLLALQKADEYESKNAMSISIEHLTLATDTNPRSEAYESLTADFYL